VNTTIVPFLPNMLTKRVSFLLTTILLFVLSTVSKANFWDGFHEANGAQQNDQERKEYDESDGYGVDIVRTLLLPESFHKDISNWKIFN
jgi:hypothetical protein